MNFGIPYDASWYSLPVKSREMMIASRIGRLWINSLSEEEALENARNRK
jgi:hypothetical protein